MFDGGANPLLALSPSWLLAAPAAGAAWWRSMPVPGLGSTGYELLRLFN